MHFTLPQCLFKGALYLTSVPVQGCTLPYLSACTRAHFTLSQCLYKGALYLTSVPEQGCTLPLPLPFIRKENGGTIPTFLCEVLSSGLDRKQYSNKGCSWSSSVPSAEFLIYVIKQGTAAVLHTFRNSLLAQNIRRFNLYPKRWVRSSSVQCDVSKGRSFRGSNPGKGKGFCYSVKRAFSPEVQRTESEFNCSPPSSVCVQNVW